MTRRSILVCFAGALSRADSAKWVIADVTGHILKSNWSNAGQAVGFGSLLKPFLALAYQATHSQTPVIDCPGASAGCWYLTGHGRQDMVSALANSCNVYFLHIAEQLNRAALDLTCMSYGLALPARSWPASRLIGLGPGWPQTPSAVVRAFASLAHNAAEPRARVVLTGMLRCCESGTGRAIGLRCYAKTGTAAPLRSHDSGDGYVTAIFPVEQPRTVVLYSRHNTTGAEAAKDIKPLIASLG